MSHGQERKELSIKLCGVRRQIKASLNQMRGETAAAEQRALHRTNKKISTHALHDYRDPQTIHDDPSDILENANELFEELFGSGLSSNLPNWVWKHFEASALEDLPHFDGRTLRSLIMLFQAGKHAQKMS